MGHVLIRHGVAAPGSHCNAARFGIHCAPMWNRFHNLSDLVALRVAPVIGLVAVAVSTHLAAQGRGTAIPNTASQRPPKTVTPQSYPPEQVRAGQPLFSAHCGFCHGRDTAGGESGPDLTRSLLVAEDVRGDKIGPVVRNGRVDKGMPAVNLSDADLAAVVAFIHDEKIKAESLEGNRRS